MRHGRNGTEFTSMCRCRTTSPSNGWPTPLRRAAISSATGERAPSGSWPTRKATKPACAHGRTGTDMADAQIVFVGPTSEPRSSSAAQVEADLARLARPGVHLTYRCAGAGPAEIRSAHDARIAAPFVVKTIVDVA